MALIDKVLKQALTCVMATAALASFAAHAEDIHVLNWKGYGTDEPWALKEFEAKTG